MDAVEDVKARLSIEDVIAEYVQLKRAGRNFKGLSPFTNEKTPSFVVSPDKQIWHDFSSGRGGDVFTFVMEVEGLDFKESLELLARKAGVDLAKYSRSSGSGGKSKERIYLALEAATHYYQVQFSKNPVAYEYALKKRRFSKQTVLEFRLGYSPASGTGLVNYLIKKSFTKQEIKLAGLSVERYSGLSDMFKDRLMIPLFDAQGRVVGFTARQLDNDPKAPKYINTPQTSVYDKSRNVYGLHLAKNDIRQLDYVVVAEGNLDVIASHQAGVKQVVATAGTAITDLHLKTIGRFTTDVRLAFDEDRAGQAAVERAIPMAEKAGVNLSVIKISGGKDPDELIQKDPKLWQKAIDEPVYSIDWLIDYYRKSIDVKTAAGKRELSNKMMPVIKKLSDYVEQDHYLNKLADILDISKQALNAKLAGSKTTRQRPRKQISSKLLSDPGYINDLRKTQNQLLCALYARAKHRQLVTLLTKDMLLDDVAKDFLSNLFKDEALILAKPLPKDLKKHSDYAKMLALQYEALYQDVDDRELGFEVIRLQARLVEKYVKTKKTEIISKLADSSASQEQELLKKAKDLDLLLKQSKEMINA
jgi:DNA primase